MKIGLKPAKYVVAVSGGVDSMVLLDLASRELTAPAENLIVAHYDHGIRPSSASDRRFVQSKAKDYDLKFFYAEGGLGADASEDLARTKRYAFLNKILKRTGSEAILTAHHKDDLLETVIINLLRGTGRKGLSSLGNRPGLIRPLLEYSKKDLLAYAKHRGLEWREDDTNQDEKYLRNHIRHQLIIRLSDKQQQALLDISHRAGGLNREIDMLIDDLFLQDKGLSRQLFSGLRQTMAAEIVASWLRKENVRLDKKTVNRLVVKLKTSKEDRQIQVNNARYFTIKDGIITLNLS